MMGDRETDGAWWAEKFVEFKDKHNYTVDMLNKDFMQIWFECAIGDYTKHFERRRVSDEDNT